MTRLGFAIVFHGLTLALTLACKSSVKVREFKREAWRKRYKTDSQKQTNKDNEEITFTPPCHSLSHKTTYSKQKTTENHRFSEHHGTQREKYTKLHHRKRESSLFLLETIAGGHSVARYVHSLAQLTPLTRSTALQSAALHSLRSPPRDCGRIALKAESSSEN